MTTRTWKCIFALVSIWLFILGYMGWQLLSVVEDSNRNVAAAMRKERHVEVLQEQNERLKMKLAELQSEKNKLHVEIVELRKKNSEAEQKLKASKPISVKTTTTTTGSIKEPLEKSHSLTPPSKEFSITRRRAEKELKEIWYFVSAEVKKINRSVDSNVKSRLTRMLKNVEDMHHALSVNMEKLKMIDGQEDWRKREHRELSDLVQRRLHHLQNPKYCNSTKKLVCQLNKGCGYGCQVHHLMYCFIVAYGYQRTLIIDSSGWRYSSKGWNGIFKPVSESCTTYQGHITPWNGDFSLGQNNVLLPIVDSLYPRPPYMPLAVPKDLAERLEKIHGHPFVWWIGQFARYLFRYAPEVEKEINDKRDRLGFKKPIVGIQVRRTDKINTEAAFHKIEEYMYWVDLYYNKLEKVQAVEKRRVYIATDDPLVFPEAEEKYKNYEFISDQEISKSAGLGSRYSDSSLHGVVFDIQMLSECDFLVCTFSSQVCRVAYERMQASQPDAADKFQSLDDIYYFGGQSGHNVRAIYPHEPEDGSQINLRVGDLVGIAGNHWDGYSKGLIRRMGREGLFPSYKVEDVMEVYDFPKYDGV